MIDYLPASLRGLMVAAFAAAFMSTIGTQLNWGASYLVNDFYRRFIATPDAGPPLRAASQIATVLLTIVSAVITHYMDSIAGAWKLLIVTGAGTGAVLILRWYWWRINAWSEVSAMAAAFAVSIVLQTVVPSRQRQPGRVRVHHPDHGRHHDRHLAGRDISHCARNRCDAGRVLSPRPPFGLRLGPVARLAPDVQPSSDLGWNLLDWLCGCALIYGALFGIGKIILKDYATRRPHFIAVAALRPRVIFWDLSRRGWSFV